MAALFVMAGILGNVTANAAEVVVPTIAYVGVDHSPLVKGDTEKFTVTSNYAGEVQYKAFIYNESTKVTTPLTNGYSVAVDAKTPFVLPETKPFEIGKYKLLLSVKRAGVTGSKSDLNGDYDTNYPVALNCVAKDDANRVYANGTADYKVDGLKFTLNKINDIGGIAGPYTYRLHIFNPSAVTPTNDGWTKRVSDYTTTPSYTFEKAGTYMVVVHANTVNSTTWKKYQAEDKTTANQGSTYGTYEAWKTIMVEVKADLTVNVFDTTVKAGQVGTAVANVKLTTEGTKYFGTATQYQLFDGTKAISNPSVLGTETSVYPGKVAGEKVTVKLLDKDLKEVKAIVVALGQAGTITVKAPVDSSKVVVNATVKKAAGFGYYITVTSTQEGAAKFQIFEGAKAISATANLGASTLVADKAAGTTVTVQLVDAFGILVASKDVVLVAAQ
jgi:hypothetical protein